ncbi:hypothetical protein DPMN_071500 [Dreissena polymorpha]|uniref:Uncharacterized protein n=1 Tax=Dreissena polymorpha TaxID=45954 RepID=A0A9D4BPQ1_DREPO|nr:hypothetical protein DPMN_071500 [Dreissena polymorpha]
MKKLLRDNRSGRLDCPRQDVEDHKRNVHSDENREQNLGDPKMLMSPEQPKHVNDDAEP